MMWRLFEMRKLVMWVLIALVGLQTVSVMHRTVHQESVTQRATQILTEQIELKETLTISTSDVSVAHPLLPDLWTEHKNATDCQLLDQACPDTLQCALNLLIFTSPLAIWLSIILLERFALFERFYAVRGPPVKALI
jgi:hypothetical protein